MARYRKSSPSDTPPIRFPLSVTWVLQQVSKHPHTVIAGALNTIDSAPTQRAQVQAVKLLGHALRDAHSDDSQKHPPELKCSCHFATNTSTPICSLALPVLVAILFESPSATAGLLSASLRSIFISRRVGVVGFDDEKDAFVNRVKAWIEIPQNDQLRSSKDEYGRFLLAAADISALAVIVADSEGRSWVLGDLPCILGALSLICAITDLYVRVALEDSASISRDGINESRLRHPPQGATSVDRIVLEAACDAAMKAAQDCINHLIQKRPISHIYSEDVWEQVVDRAVQSFAKLMELPTAPRNCAMACSVAYVSAILFCSKTIGKPVELSAILRKDVMLSLNRFPRFSQLSLLRAVMEAPAAKPAVHLLLFPDAEENMKEEQTKANAYIFHILASLASGSGDVHFRFLAMDAVISCVRRRAPGVLSPSCRDVVLGLVRERWQEPFPGVTSQIRDAMQAMVAVDGANEEAKRFWTDMAVSMVNGDWNIKGMYAPLSVLVKRIGAFQIIEARPDCQSLAIFAIGNDSRLAKPVSDWLGVFWRVLFKECSTNTLRFGDIANASIILCLVQKDIFALWERVTEHVLPVLLRAGGQGEVEEIANSLLRYIEKSETTSYVHKIRATISVMSVARQQGICIGSFSDPYVSKLLRRALESNQDDMRSSALDLVITSKSSTKPISAEELATVMSFLRTALMPGSSPSDRSRFRHGMRRLFERISACLHAARDGSGGWWMRERKKSHNGLRSEDFEEQRIAFLRRTDDFLFRCANALLYSTYPGATFARRTTALEVLLLMSENFGLLDYLCREEMPREGSISAISGCLLDEWERPRRAALELLSNLPRPVPGFDTVKKVRVLQEAALPLLDSPRQKDVDSGASICQCIFRVFVLGTSNVHESFRASSEGKRNSIRFPSQTNVVTNFEPGRRLLGLEYAESILEALEDCLKVATSNFRAACATGLFHGRCLVLRHAIQDLPWKELAIPSNLSHARQFVRQFLDLYKRCAYIALEGVSYKAFDHIDDNAHGQEPADSEILYQEEKQMKSSACFLSLKEICVSLGVLSHRVPMAVGSGSKGEEILSGEHVQSIGNLFIHVFTNTRHWGVIDGAAEGLQLLCEKLLQTSRAMLRALPGEWLNDMLLRVMNGELYVLRRSAGVPAFFNAIVNAEASNYTKCHEKPLLSRLMASLLQYLGTTHMFVNENVLSSNRSSDEEIVAHSLNLLRALFLNGNIAGSILRYLEPATIRCIEAFSSASWLIRNSAMLLFSAIVRRGVGICVERKSHAPLSSFDVAEGTSATMQGERRMKGMTAFQFFSRHPSLHQFLLEQLKKAIEQCTRNGSSDHPGLFPTLYLLSSLSASNIEDPTAQVSMKPFRAMLRKCLHWRTNYVRRAAAAASVSLIEDFRHVRAVIKEHFENGVPKEPTETRIKSTRSSKEVVTSGYVNQIFRYRPLVQNRLHGELLAIAAVLKRTRNSMRQEDKVDTVMVLSQELPARVWIAGNERKNPCSVTRASMLVVLAESFELAREVLSLPSLQPDSAEGAGVIIALSKNLCVSLQAAEDGYHNHCLQELGIDGFRHNAAKFIGLVTLSSFSHRELSFDDSLTVLVKLILRSDRETILTGYQSLLELLKQNGSESSCSRDGFQKKEQLQLFAIWDRGRLLLASNQYQDVLVDCLRVHSELLRFGGKVMTASEKFLVQLKQMDARLLVKEAKHHACIDVREQAVILLGQVVSVLKLEEDLTSEWISLVEDMSVSQRPPTSQLAACISLERCAINQQFERKVDMKFEDEIFVRGLLVLAKLLEGPTPEVRMRACKVLHGMMPSLAPEKSLPQGVLPALMTMYDLFAKRFWRSISLFQAMYDILAVPGDVHLTVECGSLLRELAVVLSVPYVEPKLQPLLKQDESFVNRQDHDRLFRLEDDLEDSEQVLRMQLIAWCYWKIIREQKFVSDTDTHSAMISVCSSVLNELRHCFEVSSQQLEQSLTGTSFFSAPSFQKCYKYTIRLFLGTYLLYTRTAPHSQAERCEYIERFRLEIEDVISEFMHVMHPALTSAMRGICQLLCPEGKQIEARSIQGILFLLHIEG